MEKGLPRGVAVVGLDGGGGDDDGHGHGGNSSGENPIAQNNNCCDNTDDGVHGKQRLDGGGGNSKSTGGGGGGRARGAVCVAVKVIVAAAAFTVTCAFVWYTMGLPFLLQVVAVAIIAFVASGGYKFIYLVYRTAPRDIRSVLNVAHDDDNIILITLYILYIVNDAFFRIVDNITVTIGVTLYIGL